MPENSANLRRVFVLMIDNVNLLDLSGPVQVFDTARYLGTPYGIHYVGEATQVTSAQRLTLSGIDPLPAVAQGDLVLVPGPSLAASGGDDPLFSPAVLGWLRGAATAGAHLASVCTGAALLGDAGLLDGRRCTSHWGVIDLMRARYPRAFVQAGVIFVHDGPISTSAGISAGIDLALSLVERDQGPAIAAAIARELVVYVRRDGRSEQLSAFLAHRTHLNPMVHHIQDVLAGDLSRAWSLNDLATEVHASVRTLTTAFVNATGMTPLNYLRELRLDAARTLLTTTELRVDDIAARLGFGDARHLRRLVAARWGQSPSSIRATASLRAA
jgi:transcriptional regulator GlxA family with amidase domain